MYTVLVVAAVAVVILAVLNRRALQRVWEAMQVQFGKVGRMAANADPLARYQEKIDTAADSLRGAKEALFHNKRLKISLDRQIDDSERQVARLDALVRATINENRERAAEYVKQMQNEKKSLETNRKQLATVEESYDANLRQVQAAQAKITEARREAEALAVQLDNSRVEAELTEITQNFNVDTGLNGLAEERTRVQKQIDENLARGQVHRDLNRERVLQQEDEDRVRKVEADAILKQYETEATHGR